MFFYPANNELKVATSIAQGDEWQSSDVALYRDIEMSSVVFQVSFWTRYETREVFGCRALGHDGEELPTRWNAAEREGGPYLMLSLRDILSGANQTFDDIGSEGARLRLQGLEMVAEVRVRNYHRALDWAGELDCEVTFRVLRNQFTQVSRFFNGTEIMAIQNGLRLKVQGTGSVGYPSFGAAVSTLIVGLAMLQLATTVVDNIAYYVHPKKTIINERVCDVLDLKEEDELWMLEELQGFTRYLRGHALKDETSRKEYAELKKKFTKTAQHTNSKHSQKTD